MKVCPNCHHENNAANVFCEQCGADLSAVKAKALPKKRGKHAGRTADRRPSWLKRSLLVAIGIVAIVVVGLGVVFYQKQVGKTKQIATIVQLVKTDQSSEFAQHLVSDDPSLKITGKTVQPFMTYVRQHPDYVNKMKTALQATGTTSDHLFTLKATGHNWVVFPTYQLTVTTMHPRLTTNVSNAAIKANDDVLATTKSASDVYTAGPLFPGHYRFKLQGSHLSATQTLDLMQSSDVNAAISLLATKPTTDTDSTDTDSTDADNADQSTTSESTQTGKRYDDLSANAQSAAMAIASSNDATIDDYTYTESLAHPDVYQLKVYDAASDDYVGTYHYDDVHNILAEYNQSTGNYETVD